MAISLSGISSNSYVACSKSIAFYIQRAVNWKNNQLWAFYHIQLSNQEKKSHKENWKNWKQQKNNNNKKNKIKNKKGKEKSIPAVNNQWDDGRTPAPERGYRGGYGLLVGSSPRSLFLSLNWAQTFSLSLNSSGYSALDFIPTCLSCEFYH